MHIFTEIRNSQSNRIDINYESIRSLCSGVLSEVFDYSLSICKVLNSTSRIFLLSRMQNFISLFPKIGSFEQLCPIIESEIAKGEKSHSH